MKCASQLRVMGVGAAVWCAAGWTLPAAVINVDFQPGPTGAAASSNYVGQGAVSDPGNNVWNAVTPDTGGEFNGEFGTGGFFSFAGDTYTSAALVDSTGAATPVTVTVNKGPAPGESERSFAIYSTNVNSMANVATNAAGLMSDYLITHKDGFDVNAVVLNNLTTGGIYNLVLYGAGDFESRNTRFVVGDRTLATTGVPGGAHALTAGQDYVVFNGVVAVSGSITITYMNGGEYDEGNFNGLQLVEATPVALSTVTVSAVAGVSFSSVSDATYRLQYTSSLLSTNWVTAPVVLQGTGGALTAFDPAGFSTIKVYRVVQQ